MKISVKLLATEQVIVLDIDRYKSVLELKKAIQAQTGIAPNQQKLMLGARRLESSKSLYDFITKSDSDSDIRIELHSPRSKNVVIQVQGPNNDFQEYNIICSEEDTIRKLKEKIHSLSGQPVAQQKLTCRSQFRQTELFNDKTLAYYYAHNRIGNRLNNKVNQVTQETPMLIFVIHFGQDITYGITAYKQETIEELKHKVGQQCGWPIEEQRIILVGKSLRNQNTLYDFNIANEESVHLVISIEQNCTQIVKEISTHLSAHDNNLSSLEAFSLSNSLNEFIKAEERLKQVIDCLSARGDGNSLLTCALLLEGAIVYSDQSENSYEKTLETSCLSSATPFTDDFATPPDYTENPVTYNELTEQRLVSALSYYLDAKEQAPELTDAIDTYLWEMKITGGYNHFPLVKKALDKLSLKPGLISTFSFFKEGQAPENTTNNNNLIENEAPKP